MNNIPIFDAEKEAGLEHLIQSNACIAYHSPVLLGDQTKNTEPSWKSLPIITKAAKEDKDIHHVYSILVTTSWNKNDDVFSKDEVWAAKNTPKYKPTNLEHDEKQIVGGIIDSWAVDNNFGLIDKNIDNNSLPEHYHILVSSVIYKQWQDPSYQKRALDLIQQIEAGDKYVSMECLFHGFDYAVVAPDGNHHTVPRNNETAFLTRHLRAYGGGGSYQDHQVGRLLRNITFSGKGFVDKPANPESIIFDKNKVFEFNSASVSSENMFLDENGVIIKVGISTDLTDKQEFPEEKINMSNEILTDQITELKNALEAAQAENKKLSERLSVANVEKYEESIEKLNKKLEASEEALHETLKELEEAVVATTTLTSDLNSKEEELKEVQSEIAAMKEAERFRGRKTSLISAGLSEEEAETKMETFGNLDDEQFAALAETLADYKASSKDASECCKENANECCEDGDSDTEKNPLEASEIVSKEDEEAEAQVDEELLETAEAEEMVGVSVEADESIGEDGTESVRSSLQDWVNNVILNNESGE